MEEPEEYVVTVLFLLPNIFGFAMKAASSAVAGPNHAIAKSATSAVLAILIASSRFGQISELYADIRQMAVRQIAILRHSYVSSKPRVRAEGLARARKGHLFKHAHPRRWVRHETIHLPLLPASDDEKNASAGWIVSRWDG